MHARRIATLAFGMLLSGALSVNAQDISSGHYWLKLCSERVPAECMAFIHGVAALHAQSSVSRHYCAPALDGVTLFKMQGIVAKHLKDNPAQLHLPFVNLVVTALSQAYPCPDRKS